MDHNAFQTLIVPSCQAVAAALAGGFVVKSMVNAAELFFDFDLASWDEADDVDAEQES